MPCPASGCTTCAASPTSATRGAVIACGRISDSGKPSPLPAASGASCPSWCSGQCGQALRQLRQRFLQQGVGQRIRCRPYQRNSFARQRQQRDDAFRRREPLMRDAVMWLFALEIGHHRALAVRTVIDARYRIVPRTHDCPPSAPTTKRRAQCIAIFQLHRARSSAVAATTARPVTCGSSAQTCSAASSAWFRLPSSTIQANASARAP